MNKTITEKKQDKALRSFIKTAGIFQTPDNFTNQVMKQIKVVEAKKQMFRYEPVISAFGWKIIAFFTGMLITAEILISSDVTFNDLLLPNFSIIHYVQVVNTEFRLILTKYLNGYSPNMTLPLLLLFAVLGIQYIYFYGKKLFFNS